MSGNSTPVHQKMAEMLVYVGTCIVPGTLLDLGRYPGLKPGKNLIPAELYQIRDPAILDTLDVYEATDDHDLSLPGFSRRLIDLVEPQKRAWVYYYDGPATDKI